MSNQRAFGASFLLAAVAGCSWGNNEALQEQVTRLMTEVEETREELAFLQEETDLQKQAIQALTGAPSPPPVPAHGSPDLGLLEQVIDHADDLADSVDSDLGILEDELDRQRASLLKLQQELAGLRAVADDHTDILDRVAGEVDALDEQTLTLRTLEGVLSFEDGRVVIDGADLLMMPAKNPDGSLRPPGQILNRPPRP